MAISKISVLWLTAGLNCDADTPKLNLSNPCPAPEVGDEFVEFCHRGPAASWGRSS